MIAKTYSEPKTARQASAGKSTGPKTGFGKARSRMNALKHGLRAEQVVLPHEDPEEFEAERQAWINDWQPKSHTRAVLTERAAAASWRLRRCVRVEGARMQRIAFNAMDKYDDDIQTRITANLRLLRTDPTAALDALMKDAMGVSALIDAWNELADAAGEPGGWRSFPEHHDRLLTLLGHDPDASPEELEPMMTLSFRLVITNDPDEGEHDDGPLPEDGAATVADQLCDYCIKHARDLSRLLRSGRYVDPAMLRARAVDAGCIDNSEAGKLHQRYEATLDRSLRATINQLIQLEKTGADLSEVACNEAVGSDESVAPNEVKDAEVVACVATEAIAPARVSAPNEVKDVAIATNAASGEGEFGAARVVERDRGGRVWPVGEGSDVVSEAVEPDMKR